MAPLNSNTTELQLAHWVLGVRLLQLREQEFYVRQMITNKLRTFRVGKLLPLGLKRLVLSHLRGMNKTFTSCAHSGVGHANLARDLPVAQHWVLANHLRDEVLFLLRR